MKKLMIVLIFVLLAATDCRKNSSEPENTVESTTRSEPELSETSPSDEEISIAETTGEPELSLPPATETQPEEKRPEFDFELVPQSEYIMYFDSTLTREGMFMSLPERKYTGIISGLPGSKMLCWTLERS